LLGDAAAAPGEDRGQRAADPPESALRLVAGQLETLGRQNAELIPILRLLPYPDAIWARAGAAICGRIVSQLPDDADQGTRAYWLNSLSARLWLAGRELEAVGAAEEAVSIRRDLAAQAPDRYLASLAVSLSYLGIQYAGLGRTDDAFKVTEEAVDVRRQLAADDPDRYAKLADDQSG
jgi:tetratricopeptide (TPR) repeat protein